ncbi:MAG: serine protease [Patescibacteria group bacterium]
MKNKEIIEKNKKAILLLRLANKAEGKISVRGTSFIVNSKGLFITAAHVYNSIPSNELELLEAQVMNEEVSKGVYNYLSYKVELLEMNKESDTALMRLLPASDQKNEFAYISPDEFGDPAALQEGDDLLFMGYPLATELIGMGFGITMTSIHCILSAMKYKGSDHSLHFLMVDTHTNPGVSGSPVFLKESGQVIAMVSGNVSQAVQSPDQKMVRIPANIGICQPINHIKEIIKKYE